MQTHAQWGMKLGHIVQGRTRRTHSITICKDGTLHVAALLRIITSKAPPNLKVDLIPPPAQPPSSSVSCTAIHKRHVSTSFHLPNPHAFMYTPDTLTTDQLDRGQNSATSHLLMPSNHNVAHQSHMTHRTQKSAVKKASTDCTSLHHPHLGVDEFSQLMRLHRVGLTAPSNVSEDHHDCAHQHSPSQILHSLRGEMRIMHDSRVTSQHRLDGGQSSVASHPHEMRLTAPFNRQSSMGPSLPPFPLQSHPSIQRGGEKDERRTRLEKKIRRSLPPQCARNPTWPFSTL